MPEEEQNHCALQERQDRYRNTNRIYEAADRISYVKAIVLDAHRGDDNTDRTKCISQDMQEHPLLVYVTLFSITMFIIFVEE